MQTRRSHHNCKETRKNSSSHECFGSYGSACRFILERTFVVSLFNPGCVYLDLGTQNQDKVIKNITQTIETRTDFRKILLLFPHQFSSLLNRERKLDAAEAVFNKISDSYILILYEFTLFEWIQWLLAYEAWYQLKVLLY